MSRPPGAVGCCGFAAGAAPEIAPPDWRPFALLLVDAQRDFFPESTAAAFPRFPERVGRLLARCRAEGIEVVHLRAGFRPDTSDWMDRPKLAGRIPCVVGTPGAEPLPFAREQPGEAVLVKQTYDGFRHPDLEPHLRAGGRRFVLLAGLVISVCVLLTAAAAVQRGYLAAVVEDGCADAAGARPAGHRPPVPAPDPHAAKGVRGELAP